MASHSNLDKCNSFNSFGIPNLMPHIMVNVNLISNSIIDAQSLLVNYSNLLNMCSRGPAILTDHSCNTFIFLGYCMFYLLFINLPASRKGKLASPCILCITHWLHIEYNLDILRNDNVIT